MREIKFRAWDKKDNLWFYFSLRPFFFDSDLTGIRFKNVFNGKDIGANSLSQSTGLKDKNGVDIYEGDIVTKHPEYYRNSEIIYDEWASSLRFKTDEDDGNLELTKYYCSKMEIIGNIYENPELIKEITND